MDPYTFLFLLIEVVALLLNGLVIYLVQFQGFRQIDMWFALTMATCDASIALLKLVEIAYTLLARASPLANPVYAQYQGVVLIFVLQLSTACVGFLALIRVWVICLRQPVKPAVWATVFALTQVLLLSYLLVVASRSGLKLVANQRYLYPNITTTDPLVKPCRLILILYNLPVILCVNLGYPCIAYRYLTDLTHSCTVTRLPRAQLQVLLKILVMMFVYDIVMLPYFVLVTQEWLTGLEQERTALAILALCMICLTIINPLMLITLHYETWRAFTALLRTLTPPLPRRCCRTTIAPTTTYSRSELIDPCPHSPSEIALATSKSSSSTRK